jgi:tetratricopeptide (TPR) repeat protein
VLAQIAFTRFVRLRRQLLEDEPKGREEADLLARIAEQKQLAEAALREAIALDPTRAFALTKLGDLHAWEGRVQEALEQYQLALAVDPEAGVNHEWLRANAAADKRLAMYEKSSREYLARPGASPRKHALLEWYQGYCLFEQKEWRRARVMFEAALAHNPEYQNSRHYAMLAAYWDGDHDAAARHAAAYARENPRGFADLIRSAGAQEQVVPVLRYLAQRVYQKGQLEDSRDLNHVLAFVLDTAAEWNNYAFLCRDTGKHEDSLAGYERALELEPESAQLLNDAAVILQYHLATPENQARARAMYEKAIAYAEQALRDGKLARDERQRNETALRDARSNLARLAR